MADRKDILIINGKDMGKNLKRELLRMGYNVEEVFDGNTGLEQLESENYPVILLNSELPGIEGNRILKSIKEMRPFSEVIVLGEHSTMRGAFDSMRLGAYDYLSRPFDLSQVISTIEEAIEHCKKHKSKNQGSRELSHQSFSSNMVGESSAMKSILDLVQKVAPTNSAVLVQGETGTGKGLIANAIHSNSPRWDKSFIVVNCSAIPDTLLESELFGYEKGAFTDATRLKHGLLEAADGGTLFLDEVSEISPSLQSKLLRVVETGDFRRLGSNREMQVDLRIVCATNRDLYEEVASRRFREDLYYRLSVVTITVPPLRKRPEDIPLLVDFFLDNLKISGKGEKIISPEAMEMLQDYDWPGNIRELRNVIERMIILSERNTIKVRDLPFTTPNHKAAKQSSLMLSGERYLTLEQLEKIYIEKVLKNCHGHRSRAAKILGVTRHTLYNKLRHFGIDEKRIASFKSFRKK
ncbi:MAG: sigma-54 dependent transcriptional regulator [candidate division WOR-3 bacterium]|nr:sigma-54 dependent transcriptional regulator [candidate division WOR-3 bacterium]